MNSINKYSAVAQTFQTSSVTTKRDEKSEKIELSREEIISSKDLSPQQKLDMLGIKPMSTSDLAESLTNRLFGDD